MRILRYRRVGADGARSLPHSEHNTMIWGAYDAHKKIVHEGCLDQAVWSQVTVMSLSEVVIRQAVAASLQSGP